MSTKPKKSPAARQVKWEQRPAWVGQSHSAREAWVAVRICQRGNESRIHDSQIVLLRQKRVLNRDATLYVVPPFHVGKIGAKTQVAKRAVLRDRLALQQRAEIVEWIPAWVIIVMIVPPENSRRQKCRSPKKMSPCGSQIVGFNLGMLIAGPQRVASHGIHQHRTSGIATEPQSRWT